MTSSTLLAVALCALRITAQSTTTISMVLNLEDSHPTPIITASILRADPTATTYVANCDYTDSSEQCSMIDQTVTTGASWQDFTSSGPEGFYRMSCTFTGTTDGSCQFTQSGGGSSYSDTLNYAAATNPFPGFMKVLVNAGVEKLTQESSPTASPTLTSQTPNSSGPKETAASSAAPSSDTSQTSTSPASGQATNGAKIVRPHGLACLLALPIIPGMLYM